MYTNLHLMKNAVQILMSASRVKVFARIIRPALIHLATTYVNASMDLGGTIAVNNVHVSYMFVV